MVDAVDEALKVLDPNQRASDETERAVSSAFFAGSKPVLDAAAEESSDPETPMAESDPDSWTQRETEALKATFRSWGRQFDDTSGGGFVDEARAVLDPTRAGSPATEQRLRDTSGGNPIGPDLGVLSYFTSDQLDRDGGVTPPSERDPQPETTPDGDGNVFSGADPTDPEEYPQWVQWLLEHRGLVIVAVVAAYVLILLQPLLEIGANATEVAS